MAIGYFIRRGDRTTCGGVVLEADHRVMMFGIAHARQGDRVFCGKDGKVYRIIGGVSFIHSHGSPVAGTLDSLSGCPCRARLLPSLFSATYQSDRGEAKAATTISSPAVAAVPLAAPPLRTSPKPAVHNLLEEEEEDEELEEAGIVLCLGLFFDGTGNNQANSAATAGCYAVNLGKSAEVGEDIRQYCATYGYDGKGNTPDNSYGNEVSNVARRYGLYPGQAEEQLPSGAEEAYLVIPDATRQAMVKGEKAFCQADAKWITGYRDVLTVGLAPGGIAKVWLMGACLSAIDVARMQGTVVKEGPDGGQSDGQYALLLEPESKAYIEKFGIPYGSW